MIFQMMAPEKIIQAPASTLKSMSYVSRLLWHFVRDKKTPDQKIQKTSFQILDEFILGENGTGLLKKYPSPNAPAPWNEFYVRNLVLEVQASNITSLSASAQELESSEFSSISQPEEYLEPRSVCFADIPFNFLPIHMERYSGIGLGFRRKVLLDNYDDLKPVTYVPRLSLRSIGHHTNEGSKCLKAYVKVESVANAKHGMDAEPFEVIYREREWRRPDDVKFDSASLACIVFRNSIELADAYKSKKFKPFLDAKVAFLNCEDFFESPDGEDGEQ